MMMNSKQRYYQEHKEEILEYQRQYRREHKEKLRESRHQYCKEHKAEISISQKKCYKKHQAERLLAAKKCNQRYKLRAFTYYSIRGVIRCAKCGNADIDVLVIDHINNDGAEHRRSIGLPKGVGFNLYLWLKVHNYPAGFQVLCYNCNIKKQREKERSEEEE